MAKKIYHYDKATGVYAGTSVARKSPLDKEDVYLIPAYATDKEPIATSEGNVAMFNGKDWVEATQESIPNPQVEATKEKDKFIAELKSVSDIDGIKKFLLKVLLGEKSGKD